MKFFFQKENYDNKTLKFLLSYIIKIVIYIIKKICSSEEMKKNYPTDRILLL